MSPIEYADMVNEAIQQSAYIQLQARSGFDLEIERRKRDMQALDAQRFFQDYQRSRMGHVGQSALDGMIAASFDWEDRAREDAQAQQVAAARQKFLDAVHGHHSTARPSGQGMTRGYWRGAVGQHPGYRIRTTLHERG